jgi:hypothetical protein
MIGERSRLNRRAWLLTLAIGAYYAWLGLFVLVPESVYSGDIGVQYVQAQAVLDHRFRSLDITYPGEFLDPERRFFPIRPPFVFKAEKTTQSIFPTASALLQAVAVSVLGLRGMVVLSVIAAWATLVCAARLAPARTRDAVIVTLGLASPLWFYAISGWHHAAGMAFGTGAFLVAVTRHGAASPLLAGVALGAGATLRDEVVLLGPGLAIAIWLRTRGVRSILEMAVGALAALGLAAVVDVMWFGRPAAAHVRHAVHFLQSALQTTDAPNAELPSLHPFTLRDRYQTVVQYWLFGYGNDRRLAAYISGLAVALFVRWRFRSSLGIVAWLIAIVGAAAMDVWEVVTAPKWLAGLHRVAPYLVFALLPAARPVVGSLSAHSEESLSPHVALITAAAYLAFAFAGVDTTGGKGLGPRLLLPLLPVLTVAAIIHMNGYLSSRASFDRSAGRMGVMLVVMSVVVHTYATTYAYYARNRDDGSVVRAVASSRERIVIADDPFTAQLLLPLYYRKIVLLADSREAAQALGSMLTAHRVPAALLVSRNPEPSLTLPGLRIGRSEQVGRMSITQWVR